MMSIQALQQTGHANNGFSRRHGYSRVSQLLSIAFGGRGSGCFNT
jgi:hypothetical protein